MKNFLLKFLTYNLIISAALGIIVLIIWAGATFGIIAGVITMMVSLSALIALLETIIG